MSSPFLPFSPVGENYRFLFRYPRKLKEWCYCRHPEWKWATWDSGNKLIRIPDCEFRLIWIRNGCDLFFGGITEIHDLMSSVPSSSLCGAWRKCYDKWWRFFVFKENESFSFLTKCHPHCSFYCLLCCLSSFVHNRRLAHHQDSCRHFPGDDDNLQQILTLLCMKDENERGLLDRRPGTLCFSSSILYRSIEKKVLDN